MTRMWYLGALYDPVGEAYRVPEKSGWFTVRRSELRVAAWTAGDRGEKPGRSVVVEQRGGEARGDSVERLAAALVSGGPGSGGASLSGAGDR